MVQIVGNLEWELLKNVEIRKSIYARITNTRFVDPLFKNFAYIKKNHTCSLLKTAPYTRKYHFSDTAQNTGHTKKRPGQHGAARDRSGTGNNARRIGILFKSNFCRNYNM